MSTRTPTRCRDAELRFSSLQLSNNHEPLSEQATHTANALLARSPKPLVLDSSLQLSSQDCRQLPLPTSPYELRLPSTKVPADPENGGSSRHPHALDLSASLKRTLAQRFTQADAHESDNQRQAQDTEEVEDKDEEGVECEEPHIDDETDGSGNQTQNNDIEGRVEGGVEASDSTSKVEDTCRRLSCACEPMVRYDELLSTSKPSPQHSQRFFPTVSAPTLSQQSSSTTMSGRIYVADARFQHCDDDIVNLCSPVTSARSKKVTFVPVDTIDEPSRNAKKGEVHAPKWTPRQFGQYYELLGFLEHSFVTPDDQQVGISSDQLDEIQRLLSSLLSSRH